MIGELVVCIFIIPDKIERMSHINRNLLWGLEIKLILSKAVYYKVVGSG